MVLSLEERMFPAATAFVGAKQARLLENSRAFPRIPASSTVAVDRSGWPVLITGHFARLFHAPAARFQEEYGRGV